MSTSTPTSSAPAAAASAAQKLSPARPFQRMLRSFPQASTLSYYVILTCVLLLLSIGVLMVLSASTITELRAGQNPYGEFFNQGKFAIIGVIIMLIASRIPVTWYRTLSPLLIGATILMQALIFVPGLGRGQGGNMNWIYIPVIGTIQPSEFVKLGLCLFLGATLAKRMGHLTHWKEVLWPGLVVAGVAVGLVLLGHDLGTVLVMVALVAGIYWFAGLDVRWFLGAAVAGLVALAGLIVSSPSRVNRVMGFLGLSEDDPSGIGYQTQHGLWALGTGGFSGVGLGASREKWVPLPEAHNDFIFAIIGEELGLMGALLVVGLFAVLAWAMMRLSQRHPDPFVSLATGGIMMWIVVQAFINIAVVIGLAPVIGIPLPMVSAGGSALISTLAAMGVVLAFARDEPGAREALQTRPGMVARSMSVVRNGRTLRTTRKPRPSGEK